MMNYLRVDPEGSANKPRIQKKCTHTPSEYKRECAHHLSSSVLRDSKNGELEKYFIYAAGSSRERSTLHKRCVHAREMGSVRERGAREERVRG
jgi:hypothetical protein